MREPRLGVTAIAHFDEFSRVWDFEGLMNDFLSKVKLMKESKDEDYWDEDDGDWEWEEDDGGDDSEEEVTLDPSMKHKIYKHSLIICYLLR